MTTADNIPHTTGIRDAHNNLYLNVLAVSSRKDTARFKVRYFLAKCISASGSDIITFSILSSIQSKREGWLSLS